MKEISSIPHSTSTEDFENYLPASPLLSSRGAGWQHVMVDGRMAEVWEIPFDLYENDRFQGKQAERLLQQQIAGS